MERTHAHSEVLLALRADAPPLCDPPLSLKLSARRTLPSHLLELRDLASSRSVLHRGGETKRAFGARRLQHQAMPSGDHKAKRSTRLERSWHNRCEELTGQEASRGRETKRMFGARGLLRAARGLEPARWGASCEEGVDTCERNKAYA